MKTTLATLTDDEEYMLQKVLTSLQQTATQVILNLTVIISYRLATASPLSSHIQLL